MTQETTQLITSIYSYVPVEVLINMNQHLSSSDSL